MANKPKATRNKAKVTETKRKTNKQLQELWAEFGEKSAQQEILSMQLQQIVNQKRQIYSKIMELARNEQEKNKELE